MLIEKLLTGDDDDGGNLPITDSKHHVLPYYVASLENHTRTQGRRTARTTLSGHCRSRCIIYSPSCSPRRQGGEISQRRRRRFPLPKSGCGTVRSVGVAKRRCFSNFFVTSDSSSLRVRVAFKILLEQHFLADIILNETHFKYRDSQPCGDLAFNHTKKKMLLE